MTERQWRWPGGDDSGSWERLARMADHGGAVPWPPQVEFAAQGAAREQAVVGERELRAGLTPPAEDPNGLPPMLADRLDTDPIVHQWATLLHYGRVDREQALAGMAVAMARELDALREQITTHLRHDCPPRRAATMCPMERPDDLAPDAARWSP